ncbi:MAG: hypothetical protein AAFQ51_07645 [Pseudomonadota bacterium]
MSPVVRLSILGLMMLAVGLLGAVAFAIRGETRESIGEHPVLVRSLETKLMRVATIRPSPALDRAYAQFARANYYGAFAASPDGVWGFITELHNPGTARTVALDICNTKRVNGQIPCRIVAELKPKDDNIGPGITLNPEGTEAFLEYMETDGAAAFAIAKNGAIAAVSGLRDREKAEIRALRTCEARAGMQIAWADPSVQTCRVIHTRAGEL